jgi:hypothetical protein
MHHEADDDEEDAKGDTAISVRNPPLAAVNKEQTTTKRTESGTGWLRQTKACPVPARATTTVPRGGIPAAAGGVPAPMPAPMSVPHSTRLEPIPAFLHGKLHHVVLNARVAREGQGVWAGKNDMGADDEKHRLKQTGDSRAQRTTIQHDRHIFERPLLTLI